ncbi:hypothetical protein M878_04635 [Streptomyces roseochromogenus subsp. oscitans DS 12.976]|uniref:Carbohydrate kinase FGGY C-terminal domain-containing protein n=1 Tax=Streptomyces roseochromogenus subsp. oscitans DS 12.976 TaxID=1352936 RepID=V6KUJ9_STRRC|nr:hypothetical protein M878_04635 [Streptomyces roseochromogenus subsp. oscitans DS 12.976]
MDVVYVVGGGTRNALLCQLTADACGLPVVAGATEAAALGNALLQARTHGLVGGRPRRGSPGGSGGLPSPVSADYPALVR